MALSDAVPNYLTPEFLRSVSFSRLRRGGYDVQEVDSFMSRFAELLESEDLNRPADQLDNSELYDPEGAAQRLLAAAQRTADSLTKEAASQAEQLVASAEAQADNIRRVVVEEARKMAEKSQTDLNETLEDLNSKRKNLEEKCGYLEGQLNAGKDQLLTIIDEMRKIIEDSDLALPIAEETEMWEIDDVPDESELVGDNAGDAIALQSEVEDFAFEDNGTEEPLVEIEVEAMEEVAPELSLVHSTEELESWIDAAAAGAEEGISNYWLEDEDDDGPPTQISPVVEDGSTTSGDRFFEELRESDPHESVLGLVDDETDAAISAFLSEED